MSLEWPFSWKRNWSFLPRSLSMSIECLHSSIVCETQVNEEIQVTKSATHIKGYLN